MIKLNILTVELEATEIRKVMEVSYGKESKSQNYFTSSLQSTVYIYISKSIDAVGREKGKEGVDIHAGSQSTTTRVKVLLLFPHDKHDVPYQLHTCKSRASLPSSNTL